MTDLIYDYISMGVDMLITAAIISAAVILLRSTTILNQYSANQQASSERINYYKEFNKYDCTKTLVTADILSAMLYYRYDLQIYVRMNDLDGSGFTVYTNKPKSSTSIDGTLYKVKGSNIEEIEAQEFRNEIASNWKFKSYIYEEASAPNDDYELITPDVWSDDAHMNAIHYVFGRPSIDGYGGGLITGIYFEATEKIVFE